MDWVPAEQYPVDDVELAESTDEPVPSSSIIQVDAFDGENSADPGSDMADGERSPPTSLAHRMFGSVKQLSGKLVPKSLVDEDAASDGVDVTIKPPLQHSINPPTEPRLEGEALERQPAVLTRATVPGEAAITEANNFNYHKTVSQGLIDFAFLTANASQLRFILHTDKSLEFRDLNISLISCSIALQIVVGLLLVITSYYQSTLARKGITSSRWIDRLNHLTLILILLIAILNIFLAAFSPTSSTTSTEPTSTATSSEPTQRSQMDWN